MWHEQKAVLDMEYIDMEYTDMEYIVYRVWLDEKKWSFNKSGWKCS